LFEKHRFLFESNKRKLKDISDFCGEIKPRSPMSLNYFYSASARNRYGLKVPKFISLALIFVSIVPFSHTFAQESPAEQPKRHISGVITATNNGISIIPSFTLGRPAVFFDLSMGGERFSFDPMLRFGMDGKPWTFVLWGRYKVIKDSRFTLSVGGHPAFLFQEVNMMVNGKPEKMMVGNRYLAGEIVTNYKVSEKFSMGLYYLRGTGIQVLGARNSDFLALNTQVSKFNLVKDIKLRINPQLFFLKVDENSGFYVNSALTLSKVGFPVELQGFFNQKIKSEVLGEDLVWNMSLLYSFSNTFSKK
jgi:hypothetical protein